VDLVRKSARIAELREWGQELLIPLFIPTLWSACYRTAILSQTEFHLLHLSDPQFWELLVTNHMQVLVLIVSKFLFF
jgi:hypothetical protein